MPEPKPEQLWREAFGDRVPGFSLRLISAVWLVNT